MQDVQCTHRVLSAVRAFCLQCSGGSRKEVERCNRETCPLHPFRKGQGMQQGHAAQVNIKGQTEIFEFLC